MGNWIVTADMMRQGAASLNFVGATWSADQTWFGKCTIEFDDFPYKPPFSLMTFPFAVRGADLADLASICFNDVHIHPSV